ncbi:MAG: biotin/lipoyl-binding protein [Saccharofermentans sp.]|nr:biotin/lipoyl-binding protein [Saccharofermentans sp.]
MKYNVTINNKVYEVEVEKGKANLVRTTDVVAAPAAAPVAAAPAAAPAAPAAAAPAVAVAAGSTPVAAPMPGTILDIKVTVGQQVKEGDLVAILEAMKMENEIFASKAGSVAQIIAPKGSTVDTGDAIITIS